ncbi:MAG: PAS domain S-box protein [Proteobacteria bacterium]|nr:PAS domain S-box protein [Pseudomonadota bacterium]
MDKDSHLIEPESAADARAAFDAWDPSPKERSDMIEVAAYHIAQRSGFMRDSQECWDEGQTQVDLMLSLRESQLKLQTILDNFLDAVVVIDTQSIITGWNPQATRIFGWTQDQAIGQPLHMMIIPPCHRATHIQGMKHYLASGDGPSLKTLIEVQALHRDGHEFPVELTIAPVRSGGKLEFNAFIRDITERMAQRVSLEQQVRERTAQLRAMAIELTMAEERERHVVAQDLHDSLGQTLAVAKLKLSALEPPQQDTPANIHLQREVKEIESLLDDANHAMRSLSLQLSPPVLHELGLVPALEWLADEMLRSFRLRVSVNDDGLPKPLDEHELKAVFRATRELLINVAKHARADSAEVEATRGEDHLVLSVADSGIGFDVRNTTVPSAKGGYGLFSVRERIDFMGGNVQIDSSPGNGTVVVMTVPLAAQ